MGERSGTEKLFLLEFLVDYVCIERTKSMLKFMDNDPCLWNRSETCVTFQFLDYPPLEISQEDFATKKCAKEGISLFKNGKSCLFSVPGSDLDKTSILFALDVAVHKKLPPEVLPGQVLIGNTTIQLADIFKEITNIVQKNPECVPVSKTMKNSYLIQNSSGNVVGEIRVFIRLSCFGKLIVTHFELGGDNKPFLFKGSEGNDIYECQKLESTTNTGVCCKSKATPLPPPGLPPPGHRPILMGGTSERQMYRPQYPQRPFPSYPPMMQQPCPPCAPPFAGNANICCPEVCATKDDKDFEEIGAEMNGHALKIRVPKKKKKKGTSCGPCAPCSEPPNINCGPCAPCYETSDAATHGTSGGCGPCSPCGDISAVKSDTTKPQKKVVPGSEPGDISKNYTMKTGTGGCGPCSPCGVPSYAPQPPKKDSCGPCAPCGSMFSSAAQNKAKDPCGPCAPRGSPSYGNVYGGQMQSMNPCGPCSPCADPYGGQMQSMSPCGPCSPCADSYGDQMQSMNPCGPCSPCADPYGGQMQSTNPCGPCSPCADPYGGQMQSTNPCGPCSPCADPSGGQMQSMNPCGPCSPCADPYGGQMQSMNPCGPCSPCAGGQMPQTNPYRPYPPSEPYSQTSSRGGQMYGQQTQMIFNQPCKPGKRPESNLFYKVTACPEECTVGAGGSCKKAIKIEPQIGIQKMNDLPENLGRDVFVLRIGKQEDSPDHKSNLELELRTPKKPPPPSEMKETQYSLTDTVVKQKEITVSKEKEKTVDKEKESGVSKGKEKKKVGKEKESDVSKGKEKKKVDKGKESNVSKGKEKKGKRNKNK